MAWLQNLFEPMSIAPDTAPDSPNQSISLSDVIRPRIINPSLSRRSKSWDIPDTAPLMYSDVSCGVTGYYFYVLRS
jgi:hypothetical protein